MTLESRPRRVESVIAQSAGGATVLLSLASGEYYSLDEVGGRVWAQCDGIRDIGEMAKALHAEFDATLLQLEADILELVTELADAKLIE